MRLNNSPIKILVDCHKFDEDYQGITTYIEGLYSELIKNENIQFYFVSYNSERLKSVFGQNENITYLKFFSKNKWYRLLIDLPKIILKYKIDFAHFQYIVPPIKFCKYIVTIHDVLFLDFPQFFDKKYKFKNNFLFKKSANLSDIVLTVSKYSQERIQHHYKLKKPVFVVSNAINKEYLKTFNKEESIKYIYKKFDVENYFLLVSRIEPRKNHLLLLKAFVNYNYYKNFNLVLVGNKDIFYKEFEEFYGSLTIEIKNKIFIFNRIDNTDLLHFFRGSKVFVYPSFAEGFGIPPLESLALNIPTICSNTTAMSDFSFLQGCTFDPRNENELRAKIELALAEPELNKRKEKMMQMYRWENSALKFIDVLSKYI